MVARYSCSAGKPRLSHAQGVTGKPQDAQGVGWGPYRYMPQAPKNVQKHTKMQGLRSRSSALSP